MNRDQYKRVLDQVEPDGGLEKRLAARMNSEKAKRNHDGFHRLRYAAAGLLAAVCLGLVISLVWNEQSKPALVGSVLPQVNTAEEGGNVEAGDINPGAVVIPEMKLPGKSGVMADMIGLVVYNGKVYTQTGTKITPETAAALRGDLLGRSTGGINEWSEPSDYKELASNQGEVDVYSVQGYDPDFRIMSYVEFDGQVFAELFEHLNGITVAKGEDVIGKLMLKGRIQSAKWQDFDSWNNGLGQYKELTVDKSLDEFITALYEAKPVDSQKLSNEGIYDTNPGNQKMVYLTLEDQTEVSLRLFKEGSYVTYSFTPVFFQLDEGAFMALWNVME